MPVDRLLVRAGEQASPFIPILILALSFVGWAGFQTAQLLLEKDSLAAVRVGQDKQVEESKKLRDGLDNLAKATLALADRGNANARMLVDELRRRGVTINPDAPPATPAAAEPKK